MPFSAYYFAQLLHKSNNFSDEGVDGVSVTS